MTVLSNSPRVVLACNGVTVDFPFPYLVLASADLTVIETNTATQIGIEKLLTTDFTILETPDPNTGAYPAGVTIHALAAPANGKTWTILNDPDPTQTVNLTNGGALPVEAQIEVPLDRLTLIVQRVLDKINRTLRQPDADAVSINVMPNTVDRASKFAAYDAQGNPIAAAGTSANLGPVTGYINTLLDDPDAATARATLGAVGLTGNESVGGNKTFSGTVTVAAIATLQALLDLSAAGAGQIKFPAVQNPSANVNTLDDYEEGTWTPAIGGNATYTAQVGTYIKIGRAVFIQCHMTINVLGTGSLNIVSGLPFVVTNTPANIFPVGPAEGSGLAVNTVTLTAQAQPTTSTFVMLGKTAAAAADTAQNVFGNGASIFVTMMYFTDN